MKNKHNVKIRPVDWSKPAYSDILRLSHMPYTDIGKGVINNTDAIILFLGADLETNDHAFPYVLHATSAYKEFALKWRGDEKKLDTYFNVYYGHVGAGMAGHRAKSQAWAPTGPNVRYWSLFTVHALADEIIISGANCKLSKQNFFFLNDFGRARYDILRHQLNEYIASSVPEDVIPPIDEPLMKQKNVQIHVSKIVAPELSEIKFSEPLYVDGVDLVYPVCLVDKSTIRVWSPELGTSWLTKRNVLFTKKEADIVGLEAKIKNAKNTLLVKDAAVQSAKEALSNAEWQQNVALTELQRLESQLAALTK